MIYLFKEYYLNNINVFERKITSIFGILVLFFIIRYLLFDFITKIYFYLHFSISNKMKSEFLIYHRTIYHLYHSILYSYLFYLLLLFQIIKRLTNESFQLISRTRFQIFLFQIDRSFFIKVVQSQIESIFQTSYAILQISVRYKKCFRGVSENMRRYNGTSGKSFAKYSENIEDYDKSIGTGHRIDEEQRADDVARVVA